MKKNDNVGDSKSEAAGQQDTPSRKKGELREPDTEKNITRGNSVGFDHEAALLSREGLVTARENAAALRENAISLIAGTAQAVGRGLTTPEQEVCSDETMQETFDIQIRMLRQANEHLVVATLESRELSEQVETAKVELYHLAYHDVLTELPNRMLLQDRLSQAIELARRQGRQLALMFLDLDRFKHINDSLGHAVGDRLLQLVAKCLLTCVRHSDTVSRAGGDEFVLLLNCIERPEAASSAAQKILAALARPHSIDGHDLHITVSIGISIYPDDGPDVATLMKNADIAMYHAKENGRNNYAFFKQEMNTRAVQRQAIEASLRRALERQEFVLHYQPKINLQSGAMVGVEALIRWQHPQQGLLPPSQFVPVAEECGLILPIGRWVLHEACRQTQAWQLAGLAPFTVAVNTSALEFRAEDFLENIRTTLAKTGLDPRYLELELTESVLMRNAAATDSVLHGLAELGINLAIDDFGTGYSSLSYLRQFPIHTLKIDQSFVNRMSSDADDATIVTAMISLGQSLKKRVIAEGVETKEQYAFLLAQRCDEGQGFYFGHPVAAEDTTAFLQMNRLLQFGATP